MTSMDPYDKAEQANFDGAEIGLMFCVRVHKQHQRL